MYNNQTLELASHVNEKARQSKSMIAVAESCTGGLLSGALTAVEGASDTFDCGFITYSYKAKSAHLGVPQGILVEHGAVSQQVASLMAEGALANSSADIAVAITGIAGPGGGTKNKPVGLVCFAVSRIGFRTRSIERVFKNTSRHDIRMQSVREALSLLADSF